MSKKTTNVGIALILSALFGGGNAAFAAPSSAGNALSVAQQQAKKITGTVTDDAGEPAIGASVKVAGTKLATVTDIDGHFEISAPVGSTLTVSYIGFEDQTVKVSGTTLNIRLKNGVKDIDEVVVVGYGSQKKSDLTGGVVAIDKEKLGLVSTSNLMDRLADRFRA